MKAFILLIPVSIIMILSGCATERMVYVVNIEGKPVENALVIAQENAMIAFVDRRIEIQKTNGRGEAKFSLYGSPIYHVGKAGYAMQEINKTGNIKITLVDADAHSSDCNISHVKYNNFSRKGYYVVYSLLWGEWEKYLNWLK